MNTIIKNAFILILIIIFIIAFSSSYSSLSIDNLAYVLAIAIDSSDTNKLEVSFQFSTPVSAESSSTEKPTPIINTVTASSLSNAINLVNGYLGKQINMSHCKVIIFSEDLAFKGISDEIYTLINDTQVRPSCNLVVSKCSAKYYLEETSPQLENLISKYYEIFANSSKYTGYMPDATIGNFFNSLICKTCAPYAILGGVNEGILNNSNEVASQKDYTIKANESSITGENGAENIGVAVFKGAQLVGELNALETIAFLNIKNDIDRFLISVPDPQNNNNYLDVYMSPTRAADIKIDTSNQTPYIKVKCEFSGRIYSMSENSKYLSSEVLDSISNSCNSYLESMFSDYLYKTSKDFNSDINGMGKDALKNFFTITQYEDYNWSENYKNAFFDVEVNTSVKSGMMITET
ncbi:MAG: Ger(x)C family spore germination C-terminal domain-containing protein [Clostridia bacterium]